MVIVNREGTEAHNVLRLRDALLEASQIAEQLQRQVGASEDAQIVTLHGIPTESVTAYKSVLTGVLADLEAEPTQTFLGNVA